MKKFEKIIEKRVRRNMKELQSGFRSEASTLDHIVTIKQITEKAHKENRNVYVAFSNLEKPFNTIPREKLTIVLINRGVISKTIRLTQSYMKKKYENKYMRKCLTI